MAQSVKSLPAMQETCVGSLGWEDPLQKEMATHSSILAWEIPWTEEPGRLQSIGSQRVEHDLATETTAAWCAVFSVIAFHNVRERQEGVLPSSPEECAYSYIL